MRWLLAVPLLLVACDRPTPEDTGALEALVDVDCLEVAFEAFVEAEGQLELDAEVELCLEGPPSSQGVRADVYAMNEGGTTLELFSEDPAAHRVEVDLPDGRTVEVEPYSDVFDGQEQARFLSQIDGLPATWATYRFRVFDESGAAMGYGTDVTIGMTVAAPTGLVVEDKGEHLHVTWDEVPELPMLGFYQLAMIDAGGSMVWGSAGNTAPAIDVPKEALEPGPYQVFPSNFAVNPLFHNLEHNSAHGEVLDVEVGGD